MATEVRQEDLAVRLRAIEPQRSSIVQAPAGSGKTSLLTLRFLRLLAVVERPEEIVAITFTRKAASEMRHRIVAALAAAARPLTEAAGPQERLEHELAVAALVRSRERGWDLGCHPARLQVQTIDALHHWLARRLPLQARTGLTTALVDNAEALYAEAAARTLRQLEDDTAVAAALARLVRALGYQPWLLAGQLQAMLGQRELWLPRLPAAGTEAELRDSTNRLLSAAVVLELQRIAAALPPDVMQPALAALRAAAREGGAASPLAPLRELEGLPGANIAALPQWRALASVLLTASDPVSFRQIVQQKQGFPPARTGGRWPQLKQAMTAALAQLRELPELAAALARVRQLPPATIDAAQWERVAALCPVLRAAAAELVVLFVERGQLDHAAVAAAAREALGAAAAPTELALALDYRIRHLLVDEYQDTSPAQERLLELLVAGWQEGDGRSLFCVGDPMQSIYGFREADVTLFLEAWRRGIGGVPLTVERLRSNFRAAAPLVEWVNATFARLLPQADDFERGAVCYSPALPVRPDEDGAGVSVHALPGGDAAAIAGRVVEVVGAVRAAAGRNGRKPTIAILVRNRASLPSMLASLRTAGIEFCGVELESLTDRPAIRDLLALLRALLHPGDRTAWLAVLRAPWCGLTLGDLLALAAGDEPEVWPERLASPATGPGLSPDGARRVARLSGRLERAIAERGERSLGSWLRSAWLALDGPATLADPSDLDNAEAMFAALDALEFEVGPCPQLTAIEAALAALMASPQGSAEAGVQVMTIHRAKGLEFDVVIVPDLQRGKRRTERQLLYWTSVAIAPEQRGLLLAGHAGPEATGAAADPLEQWMRRLVAEREQLELGRLAYVAATRARWQLHLVGSTGIVWRDGQPQLREPRQDSLLRFFWPVLAPDFERALAAARAAGRIAEPGEQGRPRRAALPLTRLPADFAAPAPAALQRPPRLRIAGESGGTVRPEFDWAGSVAQAAGEVVHDELERLARDGLPAAQLPLRPATWRRELRALGLSDEHLEQAVVRVEQAIRRMRASPVAARLLDPAMAEASSELALTATVAGGVISLRVDRTFVDPDGIRWIVDWKTGSHEGTELEAFLDAELGRYAPQLARYAEVLRRLDGRPQKVGLYFPLLDAWREWQPATSGPPR